MRAGVVLAALLAVAGQLGAVVAPESTGLREREFRLAELVLDTSHVAAVELPGEERAKALADLTVLGVQPASGRLDARGGRWALLTPVEPLVPGSGVGNALSWEGLGALAPADEAGLRALVGQAFRAYLERNAAALRIDLSEVPAYVRVTVHEGGKIVQIYQPRVVDGVPVRGSYLTAGLNSGNLVLVGAEAWGDVDVATRPSVVEEVAVQAVAAFAQPYAIERLWNKTELILVPLVRGGEARRVARGRGYGYRLAWAVRAAFAGDAGRWEALVDAHSGQLIAFEDTNHYAEVKGGVLPVTNDGIPPDGVEQPGWPMPFDNVSTTSGTLTTDTGGNVAAAGSMTSNLSGQYMRMNDNCGPISLTQTDGIDFGTSGGTDCTTPGFGGAGNTHASRTGFYELNKMAEMARGWLPSNTWLQQQLTSNMNINQTCNAFWSPSSGTVNFYRSGGGCSNTGEIAGVFDHEWGHGMDDNDAVPTIASPSGEGIADIYTALRLNTSCIGRNFRPGVNCSGFGDPCLDCTGVRDIDYLEHQSGQPHDYTWRNATCGSSVHCIGHVYSEAVWSLWKRKLQQPPYSYDNNTAWEIVNRLTFIGAGNVGTWFSGGPPFGGCSASSGYEEYLLVDDDNGNLNDGTPHMTAIYEAFNDQEIACNTPAVQDSGCAGAPGLAPAVTTNPGNQQIGLSWNAVSGASSYQVFRTEGVFGCDFGKVKIGETAGLSFDDSGLQNGRDYSYVVIPKAGPSCFGPASACATDAPVGQPDFSVSCSPASLSIEQGASDTSTCTVLSSFGYTGSVALSCVGQPAGIGCSFSPPAVSPPADGSANSTLTLTVSGSQATGSFGFDVVGDDGSSTRSSGMTVEVTPAGQNGPQDAVYDGGLGAPKCAIAGSECDSTTLLDSRDNLSPAEPNQPNTLDVCADGTSGSYHNDESIDRIVVRTVDGFDFAEGATVEVEVTVWAWSTGSSDTLDLYYAADANNPVWTYIASIVPPGGGARVLTAQYTLPAGSMQAVRGNFRYLGSASSCTTGSWNDHDDLVFAVQAASQCTLDADCDDGAFCNGAEVCNAGTCEAGSAPDCSDGVSCTDDSCNEATDSCDNVPNDVSCDNGIFCDGAEICDAVNDCQAGTPPSCDDGVGCTDDACNAGTDSCDNVPNDGNCDNGVFCDGAETCDAVNDCQAGSDPCPGQSCDEAADVCVDCQSDADCSDGVFCNGAEVCNAGVCEAGTPPSCDDGVSCTVDACNAGTDSCDNVATDSLCDNGVFCDGAETCDAVNDCQAGTPPISDDGVGCTDDSCDEVNDVIVNTPNDANCDNGLFCDGTETCDAVNDCQAGSDPCPGQSCNEDTDVCEVPTGGPELWMSFRSNTAVPGVGIVTDDDIVSYNESTGVWTLQFDGSDVGLANEIDGLAILPGGDLLLSVRAAQTLGGVSVDDSDVVRFTPSSLGANTAGSFSLYFDGSDVGLSSNGEDLDAVAIAPDGRLVVSAQGSFSGTGASGSDEDLFIFTGTLGSSTSGSFALYFDGSDVGLGGSGGGAAARDVDAAAFTLAGDLALSIAGDSTVGGIATADEDILDFSGTFGSSTSGTFSLRQDLSSLGIASNEDVGSLYVVE